MRKSGVVRTVEDVEAGQTSGRWKPPMEDA
jgi:hypothetical protein